MKFTFWHVMFFAWFCNMAMHVGMSDLVDPPLRSQELVRRGDGIRDVSRALHRLDRCVAACMPCNCTTTRRTPASCPGRLAYQACGVAGLVCVILAGWTTANPTIYRAGLAFQAIIPSASRAKVTFATGLIATVAGMFPAIAMKLLDFVALYGLLLDADGRSHLCRLLPASQTRLAEQLCRVRERPFQLGGGFDLASHARRAVGRSWRMPARTRFSSSDCQAGSSR